MVINNEVKFAERVILMDAAYVNKITDDLSRYFGLAIERKLPKADLPIFLECIALDANIKPGEQVVQVLFIYDKSSRFLDSFTTPDLKKELNDVAFKSQLGEFQLNAFEASDMASREEFYLEAVKIVADAKEVKHLMIVPYEEEYADKLSDILKKVDGKECIHVFGMNPPSQDVSYSWEMIGFAVLRALGVRSDEI